MTRMPPKRPVKSGLPEVAADLDRYSLAQLWDDEYPRFRNSRARIAQAAKLRRNEIRPHVPDDFANVDAFRITIPHGLLMVQNIIQYLTRKQPGVRRPSGPGPMSTRLSDKIEKWLGSPGKGGALGQLKSNGEWLWEALCANGANNGEYAVRVLPRPAHWSHLLEFAEDDPASADGSCIHPFFQRDRDGKDPGDELFQEDSHQFVIDMDLTTKAFEAYQVDAKARALPFVCEILHPDIVLPLGVNPATGECDSMLIRTQRTARSLKSLGFDWEMIGETEAADDSASHTTSSASALLGGGARMTMYELMVPGGIYYQVGDVVADGKNGRVYPTYIKDKEGARTVAFVNLSQQYGIEDVPGGYYYGAHHVDELNPDLKGIPLLSIFASIILGVNQTISSVVAHAYEVGFGGWLADPTGIDPKYWTEAGAPAKVKVNRGAVTYVAGRITPAVHAGVDKDVTWFVQMALGLLERFGPAQALTSGSGDQAGFAQAVAQASGENALGQILGGATSALRRICECLLEQASALSEELGEPIPVYCHYNPQTGEYKDLVEVSASDLGGDFSVEVIFPQKKGANLTLAQGMFQWWKGGGLSHYTWLQDGWGEENPDDELDRIRVEKALESQDGQQLVWELAARIKGDREMAKIARLKQQGKMTPGGNPASLIPPRPRGDLMSQAGTPTGGMQGIQNGNPAAAALGGIMNGAMQTGPQAAVTAATGEGAPAPSGGVGVAAQ
jgi:hypothetical protein